MYIWLQRYKYQVGIAVVIALAAFMRFYQLTQLPPGLHPDEAANGLDVLRILEHHDWRPFYTTNGGREALFFYLQSIGVMIFGNTILGLRAAPALIGTLSVGAVYLWVSSWFGRREGILAALLMAVTPWGVTISRDGFRAGMVALMVPLTLWLFTKAVRTNRMKWYALAGISLGAGFYTYIAFRLFPFALVLMGLYVLLFRRQWLAGRWSKLVLTMVAGAITLIPMGLYAIHHFSDIAGRPGGVSFLNTGLNHGHPLATLLDTIKKTALMFNVHGDENYRHNLAGQPEFNIFVGIMFVLGLLLAVTRFKRLPYFGLLAVFGTMLLPEVLTAEGIPHSLRAIGALPPAVALAAVGISYMLGQWRAVFPINSIARTAGTVAVAILLLLSVYQGYVQYFIAWGGSPETYDAYAEDSVALANYFNQHPFSGERYALAGGYQMQTVEYLTHHQSTYTLVDASKVNGIPLDAGQSKEFAVFEGDKEKVLKSLALKFPNGKTSPHYSAFSGNELFVTYAVPSR